MTLIPPRYMFKILVLLALAMNVARADDGVRHFGASEIEAAFATGAPIFEADAVKVHASRRDAPGLAEVHRHETDVIRVLQGRATFVTGGSLVEPRPTAPGEIRGRAIAGGEVHQLAPGDVVIVPAGTPHWFRSVEAPFLYYVVKPISR
jgi:mannose-6-phosphate isomerase-like protein (cupin superfamily)